MVRVAAVPLPTVTREEEPAVAPSRPETVKSPSSFRITMEGVPALPVSQPPSPAGSLPPWRITDRSMTVAFIFPAA